MLVDAITRLGEAIRVLSLVEMRKANTQASSEKDYLAGVAEFSAHRQVVATVRALRAASVPLPLEDFESVYLSLLSEIYADLAKALQQADDQPGWQWLLVNSTAASQHRPILLANIASLVASISTHLPDTRAARLRGALPTGKTMCAIAALLSADLAAWLRSQPSVGEESLTDWFLYRLSASFAWIRYLQFTRHKEATATGADWEWWLVGDDRSLGIRVQAKNFAGVDDVYPLLAYANRHGLQIELLLEAAAQDNLLPLFALYHADPPVRTTLCPGWSSHPPGDHGVFLADAERCYVKYVKSGRHRIDPIGVLGQSCSFACLFCCGATSDASTVRVGEIVRYIRRSLRGTDPVPGGNDGPVPGVWEAPPPHVTALLNSQRTGPPRWIESEFANRLRGISALLVFDLRCGTAQTQEEEP